MRSALSGVVLLALLAAASNATEHGTLSILVTDANGAAIFGAKIKAVKLGDSKGIEQLADKEGKTKFDLDIGDYGITVRAAGYDPDFTGGVRCRARSDFELHFMLYPGSAEKKMPHEKTPEERASEMAKLREKLGEQAPKPEVLETTYKGLDEACKQLGIERGNGGPASRISAAKSALEMVHQKAFAGAISKYKQALGEDASDALSWFNVGVLFSVEKQAKNAELCFRTAIGLCGGTGEPEYHAYLGRVLGRLGRFDESERAFKSAMALAPTQEGLYLYELGTGYHAIKDFKKAEPHFAEAIKKNCADPAVYFAHGNALEMLGRKTEALKAYRTFLDKAKDDADLTEYLPKAKERVAKLEQ